MIESLSLYHSVAIEFTPHQENILGMRKIQFYLPPEDGQYLGIDSVIWFMKINISPICFIIDGKYLNN